MCFSPIASFAASSILAGIGCATVELTLSRKANSFMLLALMPLLFSFQQFAEGLIWLCLQSNEYPSCTYPSTTIYLIFVGIIWPVWFPLATLVAESKKARKQLLFIMFLLGVVLACINYYNLLHTEIIPRIYNHSIYYVSWFPQIIIYGPIIFLPFMISSLPKMWILGLSIAISIAITFYYFEMTGCSVWCFFSGILSIGNYLLIKNSIVSVNMLSSSRISLRVDTEEMDSV